jgi:hypothetical protein
MGRPIAVALGVVFLVLVSAGVALVLVLLPGHGEMEESVLPPRAKVFVSRITPSAEAGDEIAAEGMTFVDFQ